MKYSKNILLFTTIFLICLTLSCLSVNYDYDFFARLIVGERFIEQGILPFKDFLSYTPTHPWYDHEWGAGVVFYLFLKYFGAFGTILLQTILMFGTSIFVIKTQKLQKPKYPTSILFMTVFLALFYHINSSGIRCHLFSFFCFSLFLYLMEKLRSDYSTKLIWIIPPIVVLWNNLHGGVVSGLGLIFMYMAGAILSKKPWKKYFALLAISTPLLIVNPYGYKYLGFLLSATTMHRKYIVEWWSFLAARHFWYYLLPSLYGIFAFSVSLIGKKKIDITKTIVLAVTLYSGLAHVKLLSLTLIVSAALCYSDIMVLIFRLKKFVVRLKIPCKNLLKILEEALYPAVLICTLLAVPFSSPMYPRCDLYKYPLYETEFLMINNIKGNIVVPFGLGSYVSYKLYPNNLIFMDGRYEEVYNDKEFLMLRDFWLAEDNWQDILNNYPTEILMPNKDVAICEILDKDPNWVHIFDGRICAIYVKKENVKKSYLEPEYGIDYYKRTMFCGKTFGKHLKMYNKKYEEVKTKAGAND